MHMEGKPSHVARKTRGVDFNYGRPFWWRPRRSPCILHAIEMHQYQVLWGWLCKGASHDPRDRSFRRYASCASALATLRLRFSSSSVWASRSALTCDRVSRAVPSGSNRRTRPRSRLRSASASRARRTRTRRRSTASAARSAGPEGETDDEY